MSERTTEQIPRFRRSPALDGVRGLFIVVFMAYHFGVDRLQGSWVGINVFFVLSAYLIVRGLLVEEEDFGRIDFLGFWRRRARRLLPALMVLLAALCCWGLFLGDSAARRPMRGDVLATLAFVMNWRLVHEQDQYFAHFANPSFLRHAWTLSVEEQFYLVAPLLVALLMLVRTRRARFVGVASLAVASAVVTAWIGIATGADRARVYYGTDTRSQALLVGVALALLAVGPVRRAAPRIPVSLGWAALVALGVLMQVTAPYARWMWQGPGILVSAVLAAILVAAADQPASAPSSLARVLGSRPLAWLGERTYGLYLYHWPVKLLLDRYDDRAELVTGLAITVVLAAASYRWLERPVMRHGVTRAVPVVGLTGVVVLAFCVSAVPARENPARIPVTNLLTDQPPYRPGRVTQTVALWGDSVPAYLSQYFVPSRYRDLRIVDLAVPGCDLLDLTPAWDPQLGGAPSQQCRDSRNKLGERVRAAHATSVLVMAGTLLSFPHYSPTGRVIWLDDAAYHRAVTAKLDALLDQARAGGARQLQIATLPCRADGSRARNDELRAYLVAHPKISRAVTDPVVVNGWLREWARSHGQPVVDLYRALGCRHGYRARIHGIEVYGDQIHFTPTAAVMVWTWLAPRIRDDARDTRKVAARG